MMQRVTPMCTRLGIWHDCVSTCCSKAMSHPESLSSPPTPVSLKNSFELLLSLLLSLLVWLGGSFSLLLVVLLFHLFLLLFIFSSSPFSSFPSFPSSSSWSSFPFHFLLPLFFCFFFFFVFSSYSSLSSLFLLLLLLFLLLLLSFSFCWSRNCCLFDSLGHQYSDVVIQAPGTIPLPFIVLVVIMQTRDRSSLSDSPLIVLFF